MNNSYDARLRQLAKQVSKEIGIDQYIREGVYVMLGGPAYETVAELRLLRMLGVDAVGNLLFLVDKAQMDRYLSCYIPIL